MKPTKLFTLVLITLLMSCSDETELIPIVDFQIVDSNVHTPLLTYENIEMLNNSQNGVSFQWDFGNNSGSDEMAPSYSYATSGTYDVKLTVISKDGVERTSSKKVTVLDRVLKQLTITSLNLADLGINGIDNNSSGDVFLTIKQYRTKEGGFADNLVYQSSVANLSTTDLPHTFDVLERVILDPSLINGDCLSFNINVNIDGKTYVVGSSLYSGSSFGQWNVPGRSLSFATTSVGGSFTLECDFE